MLTAVIEVEHNPPTSGLGSALNYFFFLFSQQQERINIIALENFHRIVHRLKSVDCSWDYFLWIALVSITVRTITYLWNSLSVASSWDYTYLFPWNQWTTDCFDVDREYLEYIGSITLFPCSVVNSRSTHLFITFCADQWCRAQNIYVQIFFELSYSKHVKGEKEKCGK